MSIELKQRANGQVLELHATGKLEAADYEHFVPEVEGLIKKFGKLRMLLELHDFHGWTAGALWADTKFAVKHFKDIERIAIIGEKKWQEGMAKFCKPFTTAKIEYFTHDRTDDAFAWVEAGLEHATTSS